MSFFQRRLLPQMQGKENLLKDMLNMLDKRPLDCILQIQNFTELIYLFWVSFCSAVKNELRKKQDFLTTDIAAFQSVYIIETFSTLFKETATVKREKEKALKILEDIMDRPPFLYTLDEIFHFTDITGRPLLGLYTEDDLKAFLNSRSTVENTTELPPLLIYRNKEGEQIFVNKQKVFALCVRLSAEARNQVKKAIGTRWLRLLQDFNNEPAMENDEDFDQLLSKYTLHFVPSLIYILRDKRTFIIQCEAERSQEAAFTTRFYNRNGTLLPMGTLLMLNRKAILTDVRIVLPIWYSIPILSAIFAFFKHLARGGKKPNLPKEFSLPVKEKPQSQEEAVKAAAAQIIQKLSHNKSPEAAMAELERKWHTLLDKQAKQHLITDIKSLVRDRLRRTLRLKLGQKISANTFEDLAVTIYAEAPALKQLGDAESITNYIKLYIAKLLLTIRF
jgi:hypothetical protein